MSILDAVAIDVVGPISGYPYILLQLRVLAKYIYTLCGVDAAKRDLAHIIK